MIPILVNKIISLALIMALGFVLVKCKLCPSKGEAKRLIQQGGVLVDDQKVADMFATLTEEDFAKGYVVIKKGKKVFHKASFTK